MPTVRAASWTKRDHGQPNVRDPRWNADRGAIYQHIHVERKRAWVKWRKFSDHMYTAPSIGLVVKPLDTYESVEAFIPCEPVPA
jgi:hypothetical protein